MTSRIEWTDRSDWNPVRGCTRVSPGCGGPGPHGGCYAESMAARFSKPGMWGHGYAEMQNGKPRWTGKVELQEDRLLMPLSWKKPAKVFPNSTSDFFHEALPDSDIDKLFAVMALCRRLTFQIPTKRAERMRQWFADPERANNVGLAMLAIAGTLPQGHRRIAWPLPNVWLGVSAERQQEADERIPRLLQTPAAVRFVSAEPLLGPIDLSGFMWPVCGWWRGPHNSYAAAMAAGAECGLKRQALVHASATFLDWIIVGGESGPNARPMHPQWARDIRDQCKAAGVAFFFKQFGEFAPGATREWPRDQVADGTPYLAETQTVFGKPAYLALTGQPQPIVTLLERFGKKAAGRLLDGIEHDEFPQVRS